MQHISPSSLEDLPSRISYLSAFLELTPSDGAALLAAKPLIAPLIPTILDAVYAKLLSFDITAKAFVPKNTDYEGELVKDVQELTLEHPQIALRKDFLKNYLVKLVSTTDLSPTSPFWVYLNNVGIMHTGQPGFKHRAKRPELRVEYIHMGALLGYVVDLVVAAVMDMDIIDSEIKSKVIRALNKVIWIQNDLMARHYLAKDGDESNQGVTPPLSEGDGEGSKSGCPFSG
ncbi:Protoglobin-domain-containing protein [Cadophora sp. MPI-SDFR-AT-0126]|nr:Protoglobin-domain-containing protein [Leotiomycetes sp. MPI-SDFR-AT-0126]